MTDYTIVLSASEVAELFELVQIRNTPDRERIYRKIKPIMPAVYDELDPFNAQDNDWAMPDSL